MKTIFFVDVASFSLFPRITCDIPVGSIHPAPTRPFSNRKIEVCTFTTLNWLDIGVS